MRQLLSALCLLTSLISLSGHASDELKQQAAEALKPLAQELLATVQNGMASSGPEQTVQVCRLLAPTITERHNQQQQWQIRRTALKVRNPENHPDDWERQVLEYFAKQAEAGVPIASLNLFEHVDGHYRYMQAIPTGEPCLACHGQQIESTLAGTIDSLYPDDQAKGFRAGELRGAFSLSLPD